jgi:hypothetical protein
MPHQLVKEQADLSKLPTVDSQHRGGLGSEITIGDLHGNAMKLIYMLAKHDIASNLTQELYTELVNIYNVPVHNLTKDNLLNFKHILNKIDFKSGALVRLIGDELCDRGSNDYFTLLILQKMNQCAVSFEIMVSNHSIEYLDKHEKKNQYIRILENDHARSMINLEYLITHKLVLQNEIDEMTNQFYKINLLVISYSLSVDKKEITIFSHAPIGLANIKELSVQFSVTYDDSSAENLAQTIDTINKEFQELVNTGQANSLYSRKGLTNGYRGEQTQTAFEYVLWNRNYKKIERPKEKNGFHIQFVHGHDNKEETNEHIINLDNTLGYTVIHPNTLEVIGEIYQGLYTALYTPENHKSLFKKLRRLSENPNSAESKEKISLFNILQKTPINPEDQNHCKNLVKEIKDESLQEQVILYFLVEPKDLREKLIELNQLAIDLDKRGESGKSENAKKLYDLILKEVLENYPKPISVLNISDPIKDLVKEIKDESLQEQVILYFLVEPKDLREKLIELNQLAIDLDKRGESEISEVAKKLYDLILNEVVNNYPTSVVNSENSKVIIQTGIREAKPLLQKHRGFRGIFRARSYHDEYVLNF